MIFPILTSKSRKHKTFPLTGKAQVNHFALSSSSAAFCAQTHSYFKLRILTACFKVFYTKSVCLLFKPGENKQTNRKPPQLNVCVIAQKELLGLLFVFKQPWQRSCTKTEIKMQFHAVFLLLHFMPFMCILH